MLKLVFALLLLTSPVIYSQYEYYDSEYNPEEIPEEVEVYNPCPMDVEKLKSAIQKYEHKTYNYKDRAVVVEQANLLKTEVENAAVLCPIELNMSLPATSPSECKNDITVVHLLNDAFLNDRGSDGYALMGRLTNLNNYLRRIINECSA